MRWIACVPPLASGPAAISFCGLKDKQGRTEQLIAVDGADVDMQEPDLRLKYLGRTNKALSAANITSNRFAVTVRALDESVLGPLNVATAEINRLGVVNYFDSQRFGSLKHGQGFIAKDLIRGDFEAALKNYFAKPSELDRSEDAKVKQFWKENWGHWNARVPFEGSKKYHRILKLPARAPQRLRCAPSCRSTRPTARCCCSPTRAICGTRACGATCSCCCRASTCSPCATRPARSCSTATPAPRCCARCARPPSRCSRRTPPSRIPRWRRPSSGRWAARSSRSRIWSSKGRGG